MWTISREESGKELAGGTQEAYFASSSAMASQEVAVHVSNSFSQAFLDAPQIWKQAERLVI